MSESPTNEHGVEIFTRRIFRWDELDTVHWDDDGLNAQIVTGEHMHLIRAAYAPGSSPGRPTSSEQVSGTPPVGPGLRALAKG